MREIRFEWSEQVDRSFVSCAEERSHESESRCKGISTACCKGWGH